MFKRATLFSILISSSLCVFESNALEPLKDRARVASMHTQLLLPDYSILPVDMNFDCGAAYENTGVIIMNDEGAQLLAAGYAQLYGPKAADYVLNKWFTKRNQDDPRKPSFLVVKPPKGLVWNANPVVQLQNAADFKQTMENVKVVNSDVDEKPVYETMLESHCGTRNHSEETQ